MKNLPWTSSVAWVVLGFATAWLVLWGLAVASSSVVVDRQGFGEFGIAGGTLTMGLLFAARGLWKFAAIPLVLFVGWCLVGGQQRRLGLKVAKVGHGLVMLHRH